MNHLIRDVLLASGGSADVRSWTVVASSSSDRVDSNSTVNFPSGYQAGDAVIVFVARDGALSFLAPPSGWREAIRDTTTNPNIGCFYLDSITTQTSFTGTFNQNSGDCTIQIVILRPSGFTAASLGNIIIEDTGIGSTAAGLPNPPSLTTTTDDNLILAFGASGRDNMIYTGSPSGFTTVVQSGTNARVSCIVASATQATAGTIDPAAFSGPNTDAWAAFTISVRTRLKNGEIQLSGSFSPNTVDVGGNVVASNTVTVTIAGGGSQSISIAGGSVAQYQINGGVWTSSAGTVFSGDTVAVRQTSVTGTQGTTTASVATLTIGTFSTTYTLSTRRELVFTSGTTNFTVANGITSLNVVGVGGGGSGGLGYETASVWRGGGGGGGGAMSITPSLAVSGGNVLSVTVGAGGTAGGNGGDSSIVRSGVTLWLAKGGDNGKAATSTAAGAGGSGGSFASSIGTTRWSGGTGGAGVSSTVNSAIAGGGGGGAGGYSAVGSNGAGGTTSTTTANSSSAASGGAASGGGSTAGGGGTGVSGSGSAGGASNGGGIEGSADIYASNGGSRTAAFIAGNGGIGGGGGGGTYSNTSGYVGNGGSGLIRITW